MTAAPLRPVKLGPRDIAVTRCADGGIELVSPHALGPYPRAITERLVHWAEKDPDRVFIAERDPERRWRKLTYAETLAQVRAIGQALLDRSLSAERPLAFLSGNDIEQALLGLAAAHVGIPFAPISPAYSLVSTDHGKLGYILGLITPGLVFVSDAAPFAPALAKTLPKDAELVAIRGAAPGATPFAELAATRPTGAVEDAFRRIDGDSVLKFLFTSGTTGMNKAVINTQRMICANQAQITACYPFLLETPPINVEWAPWNHTAGGNKSFYSTLHNGGTYYIDDGRPLPGQIERSVENLRDVSPTVYWGIPRAYEMLLPFLRNDPDFARAFFGRLHMLFYAAANLSQSVRDELVRLAVGAVGERLIFTTSLGSTETGPFAIATNWEDTRAGMVGLPAPGLRVKLAPVGDKLEARVRGPNITPGYWRQPEPTAAAFDEDGWFRMGDAMRLADPDDPARGLLFDGRIAENFKLATGTWVNVGQLRAAVIQAGHPLVREVVIAGQDRDYVAALVFPNLDACRALCPTLPDGTDDTTILAQPAVRARFQATFEGLAATATGSANRIERALLLAIPPSIDAHEITDKGSINQRAVLDRRAVEVAQLYGEPPAAAVLVARVPASAG